jgi:hypothetical protein
VQPLWARGNEHAGKVASTCKAMHGEISKTPTTLVLHMTASADKHRKQLCDTYLTVFWIYKNKMNFTSGEKVKEVRAPQPATRPYTIS